MASDFARRPYGSFRELGRGSRIAGYLIEEQIGAGGMAVVFRAHDEVLGRLVAVKVIAPSMAGDEEFRARFLRESRAAAAVESPYIIPVYAAGDADGLLYIATRYVAGGDLAALAGRSGGLLAPDAAVQLVRQVASALDAAHAAGLVHRDVKPGNILVETAPGQAPHAYLSDFGLSKAAQSATGLTATGQFVGTPDYCAPEQIRSASVDGRTDQYSLACVAFVLLTGTLPFHRAETMATMYAQVHDPMPSLTGLRPELPAAVDKVVARALAKSPGDRYGHCGEFAAALREALLPPLPASGRRPWMAGSDVAAPGSGAQWARQQPGASTGQPSPALAWSQPPARSQPPGTFSSSGRSSSSQADERGNPLSALANDRTQTAGNSARRTPTAAAVGVGRLQVPAAIRRRERFLGVRRRTVFISGAAAVVLAAAGVIYGIRSSPPSPEKPVKPVVVAKFAVPGGGTVDATQLSPDGKLVAAENYFYNDSKVTDSKIYVWNTVSRSYVRTITVPDIAVNNSKFHPRLWGVAFSADDTSLTAKAIPDIPGSSPVKEYYPPNVVYRWNLATGKMTMVGSVSFSPDCSSYQVVFGNGSTETFPSRNACYVVFSGDGSTAFIPYDTSGAVAGIRVVNFSRAGRSFVMPGVNEIGPDAPGDGSMIIASDTASTGDTEQAWDAPKKKVLGEYHFKQSGHSSYLSPDGKTVLTYPLESGNGQGMPVLWNVAGGSDITPFNPLWKQQDWADFSTDGSVIVTGRAGGKDYFWSVATRQLLLTMTGIQSTGIQSATTGPGGSEVVSLASKAAQKTGPVDGFRQVFLWETPLEPQ